MAARLTGLLVAVVFTIPALASCTSGTDAVDPDVARGTSEVSPTPTPTSVGAATSAPTSIATAARGPTAVPALSPPPAATAAASPTAKPAPAAAEPTVTPAPTPPPSAPAPTGAPDVSEEVSPPELGITLDAVDEICDVSPDFQGAAQVRWTVDGGRAPYEVWVNGELQVGESGVVEAPCVGLRWVDFRTWTRTAENLPLTVVGTVIDAGGVRASDLLLIQRPPAGPNPPGNETQAFDGAIDTLTLELFAPRICDAQVWGRYSRIPFAGTGADDVTMEVEWRVSGGRPPYTVYLAGGEFEGDSGTLRLQCRHLEDGVLDSGWLSVMGLARDSEGAVGSAIVETFALARSASTPGVENYRMNGGRTYKFEGILMTIPDGLTIDVGGEFGSYHVHCRADACRDSSCANSTYSNVCEDAFRVATLGGQVGVTFGYGTGQMLGRGTILEGWREDSGVQTDSRAELEALMDAWAESVGRALDLSAARWLNPAPLRITAYPDPVVCDPSFDLRPVDDIGFVHVIVAGGAWVPTGIELDGEVVALARGSGRVVVRVDCSREPGMHDMLLNVHDLGPQTPASIVETTIEMNFLPSQRVGGGLGLRTSRTPYHDQTAFDPTAYCEPGGKAKIAWSLFNSHATGYGVIAKPTTVRIDGELAVSQAHSSQISVDYGEHWVTCQQEPGLQTVVIEATDSGTPQQSARYEYLLRVVESHPSGLEWSEIRPDDYPPPPLPVPAAAAPSDAAEQCRNGTAVASPEDNPGLVSDCAALLKAGALLAGDTALDWDAGTPIARWEGVTVRGQPGRVVAIELVMRGLTGSIPPELGTLAELQDLNLSYNRLTGTIPVELGALSNLRELGLIANALTGTIPAELGALDDLQFLGLTHNQLTGTIPPELGALGDLRYLDVADNQLTGTIPVGLGGLRQLETLGLAGNQLTGTIPPELGGLRQLETLSLAANRLTGAIPVELGGLRNLHTLNLIRNQLTGTIPAELGGLGTLEFLHLSENQLTGTIPVELRALRNLKTLGVSDNELTGSIPPELGVLGNLEQLGLRGNRLTGSIPVELSALGSLVILDLTGNELTGAIPAELASLSTLRALWLSDNRLTGAIPAELGALSTLRSLNMSDNHLTGAIPAKLGALGNLHYLGLSGNRLTGAIPAELGALAELQQLYLGGNDLAGCIPPALGTAEYTDLDTLGLAYCEAETTHSLGVDVRV